MISVTYERAARPASRCWRRDVATFDEQRGALRQISSSRRIRSAPRASRRRASSAPSAAASAGAPVTVSRIISDASGRPTRPATRQPPLGQRGVTGDRRAAADAQAGQQRALGGRRHLGLPDRRARGTASRRARRRRAPPAPARPARSPAACASASSRSVMRAEKPEAIEPGAREHRRVDHALGDLAQARVDVAAQDLDRRDRRAPRAAGRRGAGSTCRRGCPAAAPPAPRRRG